MNRNILWSRQTPSHSTSPFESVCMYLLYQLHHECSTLINGMVKGRQTRAYPSLFRRLIISGILERLVTLYWLVYHMWDIFYNLALFVQTHILDGVVGTHCTSQKRRSIYTHIYNWSRSAYENICQCCFTPIDRNLCILVQITQFSFVYSPPPHGFRGNAWNYRLLVAFNKMRQNLNERLNIILACWWQLFNKKVVSQSPSAFHTKSVFLYIQHRYNVGYCLGIIK